MRGLSGRPRKSLRPHGWQKYQASTSLRPRRRPDSQGDGRYLYYSVDGVVAVRKTCSHSRSVRLSITRPAVSAARGAARETPRRTDLPVFSAASAAIGSFKMPPKFRLMSSLTSGRRRCEHYRPPERSSSYACRADSTASVCSPSRSNAPSEAECARAHAVRRRSERWNRTRW